MRGPIAQPALTLLQFVTVSPHDEYLARLRQRQSRVAHFERLHIMFGNVRLALFVATIVLVFLAFHRTLSFWWIAAPAVVFIVIAIRHARIMRLRTCAERLAAVYQNGLARMEDRWAGLGESGERFYDPHHIYAGDLDLFGRGSIFELLSTCRTRIGEEALAAWLLAPAAADEILARHAAIDNLRDRLDFREELAVLGEDARTGVHPHALLEWAEASVPPVAKVLRILAPLLAVAALALAVLWGVKGIAAPFFALVLVEGAITYAMRKRIEKVMHSAEHAFADLKLLVGVLRRMEREAFTAPLLLSLQQTLRHDKTSASHAISRLSTLVDFAMSRDNLILRVFDIPLLYSVQVTLALEGWQRRHGQEVRRWLAALGEIEALLALATYRYEHPDDVFPEFVEDTFFEAVQLGHPLLGTDKCVRNDVALGKHAQTLLVSGSNMSGKSTLLRAIGIATVMAMAGAPVRARRLALSALQVGASIRINDSLQEGASRFYAEITRLRRIFDLACNKPALLFLLDELLQGTNSADRRVGAEGLLRALVECGAIGVITTHDLALTDIAGPLHDRLHNMHFQDELENGKIRFDYKLREGVVTKSNGLELMRSIGLRV